MRPEVAPTFEHDLTKQICLRLTKLFTGSRSFNEFLEEGLSIVREAFGDATLMLVDYRENTDYFDLLHFEGFSENARFDLQHRLQVMDLRRALKPEDLIVLFTDGLTDLRDSKDNFFGVEGITGTLSNHRGLPLKDLAKSVLGQAMAFARAPTSGR